MDLPKRVTGFRIEIDKTPAKWSGSIQIESRFDAEYMYVTSSEELCYEAVLDILNKHNLHKIEGINIRRVTNG